MYLLSRFYIIKIKELVLSDDLYGSESDIFFAAGGSAFGTSSSSTGQTGFSFGQKSTAGGLFGSTAKVRIVFL